MARKLATSTHVDRDALLEFLRPRHRALLLTRRSTGSPQLSPVTCGVDGEGRDGVGEATALAVAAAIDRDLRAPGVEELRRVALLPGSWASTGGAVDVALRRERMREWLTIVPITRREARALRLLLVDEPEVSFRTAPRAGGASATGDARRPGARLGGR